MRKCDVKLPGYVCASKCKADPNDWDINEGSLSSALHEQRSIKHEGTFEKLVKSLIK